MDKVVVESAARATADVLREEIFSRNMSEEFLGSEDELLERLGVSRPTLRQAARILESEQLLTVRRGWNGGFYTRRPDASVVARISGLYLRSQKTTFGDVWRTLSIVGAEAARLAAASPDLDARRDLLRMVLEADPADPANDGDIKKLTRLRLDFLRGVVALVPSATLQLVISMLSETTRTSSATRWFMDEEQRRFTYDYLEKTARAIANGYGEAAAKHYLRFGEEAAERFPALMSDIIEPSGN
ncbi:GntR family transcriptional regulator [Rhodococcus sp. 14C212]|uniref:FadR/GntR family transcriptional regulator n=1 Tax=Rhodococcus sp. 14C212 TaxID=2711209 RepID=UPI0013EAF59C|nr:GntR family transcriptional regulator [Rhodococcus sp. 14C212]NGP08661.1 GntR family transcriptional regulator [Rhodococcus sp. 14C212]